MKFTLSRFRRLNFRASWVIETTLEGCLIHTVIQMCICPASRGFFPAFYGHSIPSDCASGQLSIVFWNDASIFDA
jgi:hypothetical protein